MMFHTGQNLNVSGPLDLEYLKESLEFGLKLAGEDGKEILAFQITKDNKYCIGWHPNDEKQIKGWTTFPPGYTKNAIADTIRNYLSGFACDLGMWDGTYEKGFLMKAISVSFESDENIINPLYGYLSFEPFTCFYAK